jgi:hypothetical protein
MLHVGDPLEISVYFEYPLYLSGMHQVSNKLVYNDERWNLGLFTAKLKFGLQTLPEFITFSTPMSNNQFTNVL